MAKELAYPGSELRWDTLLAFCGSELPSNLLTGLC
jgi:hypothetical protein